MFLVLASIKKMHGQIRMIRSKDMAYLETMTALFTYQTVECAD